MECVCACVCSGEGSLEVGGGIGSLTERLPVFFFLVWWKTHDEMGWPGSASSEALVHHAQKKSRGRTNLKALLFFSFLILFFQGAGLGYLCP